MRKLSVFLVALLLAGASASFAQDVRYNFDKQANFSGFKTYRWVPIKGAQAPNELVDGQIKAAIDSELHTKGLSRVETDNADLYIGYQVAVNQEKEYTTFNTGWGYGPGWGGAGWYGGGGTTMTTGTTSTIYIGQLAVDMYSSSGKALVWRGNASKTIDTNAKPEKQQKNLAKAVKKLFKNYPPPVKK
jgi:hypothetical protein